MTARGYRKGLSYEETRAAVEAAETKRLAEVEVMRFRQSIAWYDAKGGFWTELEVVTSFPRRVAEPKDITWYFHPTMPRRVVSPWGYKQGDTHFPAESGFVGDGLPHCVWYAEGMFDKNLSLIYDHKESKTKMFSQYVAGTARIPQLFLDIYGLYVGFPQIHQAYLRQQNEAAAKADASDNVV